MLPDPELGEDGWWLGGAVLIDLWPVWPCLLYLACWGLLKGGLTPRVLVLLMLRSKGAPLGPPEHWALPSCTPWGT